MSLRQRILAVVVAVAALAAAIGLQVARDRRYSDAQRDTERLLYIRSGPTARRAALAFQAIAADIYWIRAIQHYGGDRLAPQRPHRYELMAPLLDLTTALDPYFTIAYRFGAIFLSEPYPGGPGVPDQAIALLKKGLTVQPTKWQYFHDIAFVYYWHRRDPVTASQWLKQAAEQPNAPNWLGAVAANMLIEGGDRRAALAVASIQQSEEPWLQKSAERTLLQPTHWTRSISSRRRARSTAAPERRFVGILVRQRALPGLPLDAARCSLIPDGEVTLMRRRRLLPRHSRRPQ